LVSRPDRSLVVERSKHSTSKEATMSTKRALPLMASLIAILAMLLGSATAAEATRKQYPPTSPSLTVDRGRVNKGTTVHATGKYGANERVTITITFRPEGSRRARTIRRVSVRTDRRGRFSISVRTTGAGTLVITASARNSQSNASATVTVTDFHKRNRAWQRVQHQPARHQPAKRQPVRHQPARRLHRMAYSIASLPSDPPGGAPGLAIAGLLVLTGAAGFTRQAVRRRRRRV
jgi:hypothetical protein